MINQAGRCLTALVAFQVPEHNPALCDSGSFIQIFSILPQGVFLQDEDPELPGITGATHIEQMSKLLEDSSLVFPAERMGLEPGAWPWLQKNQKADASDWD